MNHLAIIENKIKTLPEMLMALNVWHLGSKKIVFTNGCFDILHHGHIHYLSQARDLGDRLIIGLNSDASVKRQGKGDERPVNKEQDRAILLAALHFVDGIVIFDEDTPLDLIKAVKPDVLVKGSDYNPDQNNETEKDFIVGSKIVKAYGGNVQSIPFLEGFSTSSLIEKLKNS